MIMESQYEFARHITYTDKDDQDLFKIKYVIQQKRWGSISRSPIRSSNRAKQFAMVQQQVPQVKKQAQANKQKKRKTDQDKQVAELKQYSFVNTNKIQKQINKQEFRRNRDQERQFANFAFSKMQHEWIDQDQYDKFHKKKDKNKPKINYLEVPKKIKRSRSINTNEQNKNKKYNKNYQFQAFKEIKPSYNKNQKRKIYDDYHSIEQILDSIEDNQNIYFRGTVDCDQRLKFFVRIFTSEVEGTLVAEGTNKNRCIHGDQIYFTIIERTTDKIKCKVVYIIPYEQIHGKKREIIGRIQLIKSKNIYVLNPINKRFISFNIRLNQINRHWLEQRDKKYFIGNFVEWSKNQEYPQCLIINQFGNFGQVDIQTGALLKMYSVYDEQYTQEQIEQGLGKFIYQTDQKGEYRITEQQIKRRTDLRSQMIFTIDPLTARDFDDALSIKTISKKEAEDIGIFCGQKELYQIGVHIADASFFVEQKSVIDEQAKIRTTSVYLVHRVLPMLPRILCETMCSLNPGLQRLTLSVWFYIDEEGTIFEQCKYDRSVINSKARFTYELAQQIINDEIKSQKQIQGAFGCVNQKDYDRVAADIKLLNKIATKTRENRISGGALVFQIPKKSFVLNQKYFPIDYKIQQRFQAHFLVEQFMLLANQKVAQVLVRNVGPAALLRRHKFPGQKKIARFQSFMKKIGQQIKIKKGMKIQQEIGKILDKKLRASVKGAIKYQMIFLLELADYFLVNKVPQQQWIHYALNMKTYTHFTSPIRRYPDIIVHRLLIAVIQAQRQKLKQPKVPKIQDLSLLIQRCNKNKSDAKKVSSNCQKIFLCLYLKGHPVQAQAILVTLDEWGFKISVPQYDIRTSVELKKIKKVKVLKCATDNQQRKYLELEYSYSEKEKIKVFLKELQEIDVRLQASDTFPIDYNVKLLLPNPKNLNESIILE